MPNGWVGSGSDNARGCLGLNYNRYVIVNSNTTICQNLNLHSLFLSFDNSQAMVFDRMTFGILTNISLTKIYFDNWYFDIE